MKTIFQLFMRLLSLIMAIAMISTLNPAYGEQMEIELEKRTAFAQLLFSAVAGTTYESEKLLFSELEPDEQVEHTQELLYYRKEVKNWLLAALGSELTNNSVQPWTPDNSYALFKTTETGTAYIDKLKEMGCEDAADALEFTRKTVQEWLEEIDHEILSEINEDYSFWLYAPDSPIDYPVVHGEDNQYYLKRMLNGEKNACGTLFVDCRNLPDFTDPNTLIHGHHMRDGSMFKSITYYKEKGYFDSHPYMLIIAKKAIYLVEIIAGYTASTSDQCYDMALSDRNDLNHHINGVLAKSDFEMVIDPLEIDRLVTFSTCDYSFNNARYAVIGNLVMIVESVETSVDTDTTLKESE